MNSKTTATQQLIRPEHALLSISDLITEFIGTDANTKTKTIASQAIAVITGSKKTGDTPLSKGNDVINFLPELLHLTQRDLEAIKGLGKDRLSITKGAIENLGYEIGLLSSDLDLQALRKKLNEEGQEFSQINEDYGVQFSAIFKKYGFASSPEESRAQEENRDATYKRKRELADKLKTIAEEHIFRIFNDTNNDLTHTLTDQDIVRDHLRTSAHLNKPKSILTEEFINRALDRHPHLIRHLTDSLLEIAKDELNNDPLS